MEYGDGFEPLLVFKRGNAGVNGFGRNVAGDAAFGGDDGAIADFLMAGGAYLPGKDAAFADDGGPGESDLAAEHGVRADFTGVANQDQIIDFCSTADAGFA